MDIIVESNKKIGLVYYGSQAIREVFKGGDRVYAKKYTLNVPTSPSDATVTFSTGTVLTDGHSCVVPYGTTVNYTVSKAHYVSQSFTKTITKDETVPTVDLELDKHTLTINVLKPTSGATVTFSTGTVEENVCTVYYGTSVTYSVSSTGYISQSGTILIDSDKSIDITLVMDVVFPSVMPVPSSYTETLLVSVTGSSNKRGTISEAGWYRIATRAESGSGQWSSGRNATGGCVSDAIVWLYEGSKYLIWGASGKATGYISPSGLNHQNPWNYTSQAGVLGGSGSGGCSWNESGGGGGGAGGHGMWGHKDAGYGGGGSGCIIGIDNASGTTLTESWSHGGFSVTTVECMVLAGGGGSNQGDNGEPRTGGGGGGAWGRGGKAQYGPGPGSGPGGEWGHGEDTGGGWWAGPTRGAWCIRNFSTGSNTWGVGIKSGSSCNIGSTYIYKLNY